MYAPSDEAQHLQTLALTAWACASAQGRSTYSVAGGLRGRDSGLGGRAAGLGRRATSISASRWMLAGVGAMAGLGAKPRTCALAASNSSADSWPVEWRSASSLSLRTRKLARRDDARSSSSTIVPSTIGVSALALIVACRKRREKETTDSALASSAYV